MYIHKFTVEEIYLICFYGSSNRTEMINKIKDVLPYATEPDMKEIMQNVVEKLNNMNDGEFAELGLIPVN